MPNPVVVQRPSSFPFENTNVVPWKYDTPMVNQRFEKVGQKEGLKIAFIPLSSTCLRQFHQKKPPPLFSTKANG